MHSLSFPALERVGIGVGVEDRSLFWTSCCQIRPAPVLETLALSSSGSSLTANFFSPTLIFGGATISFDAAWDAASLCTLLPPPPPLRGSHSRACAARPMQATASASARASASAPETLLRRAPGGWGAVPRCASPSLAPAPRVPAPLAPARASSASSGPAATPAVTGAAAPATGRVQPLGEAPSWWSGGVPFCGPLPERRKERRRARRRPRDPSP